jgi:putative tricarboxylic transport membrane protein
MVLGAFGGIVAAAIPGFTITMAVILTLPLTFGMSVMQGLATMIAVMVGGLSGGLISAALLGIPGTPSAVATTFDGFPMASKGQPGRALAIGMWSGFGGGLIGMVVLIFAAPPLALVAIKLGAWEYFSLMVFALTVIAGVSGDSLLKGMLSGIVGLMFGVVGPDPMLGVPRFAFGTMTLTTGIPFLVVLIGLYAVSQLLGEAEQKPESGQAALGSIDPKNIEFNALKGLWDTIKDWSILIRSSLIGVVIGALPGAGSSISNLMAYDHAKRSSKTPEKFGTGIPAGIVSSEAGAAGTAGGGLIPMIALGIPGTAIDAIFMAALMVHGITIGPRLIIDHADTVYGMFLALGLSCVIVLIVAFLSMRIFMRIVLIPKWLIGPAVLVFCAVGAFALTQRVTDLYSLLGVGVLGYIFVKLDYPLAPAVLGVVLEPLTETNLRRALMIDSDWTLFFTRPVSLALLLLAVGSIVWTIVQRRRAARKNGPEVAR